VAAAAPDVPRLPLAAGDHNPRRRRRHAHAAALLPLNPSLITISQYNVCVCLCVKRNGLDLALQLCKSKKFRQRIDDEQEILLNFQSRQLRDHTCILQAGTSPQEGQHVWIRIIYPDLDGQPAGLLKGTQSTQLTNYPYFSSYIQSASGLEDRDMEIFLFFQVTITCLQYMDKGLRHSVT
jgi:hypothetical protein